MLKSMRKNIKSLAPTLWFVIAAFIISIFAVWGGAGRLGESRGSDTIVSVGGDDIQAQVYINNLRQRLDSMREQFSELNAAFIQQLNIPQQVLEQIIQQSILTQTAKKMGIHASKEEIRNRVIGYPVFQRDGQFIGFEEYRRILTYNRISPAVFEKSLTEEIKINKLVQVLTAGITVSREEIWEDYKKNNETAKIEYVVFEFDKTELPEEPAPDRLHEYFTKNQGDYEIPEKRGADYYFINTEVMKETMTLEESELQAYYQENQSQFMEPAKTKVSRIFLPLEERPMEQVLAQARTILERIDKGEDFGRLATTFSRDEKAETEGDWGEFEWRRLTQEEQDTIQSLARNDVSNPLELEDGVAILKVTEKAEERQKSLEEVRDQISNLLKDQQARARAEEQVQELEKAARRENSLDVAAQKLGFKISATALLAEGDAIEDIDPSGTISRALFNLEDQAISAPLYTFKGVGLAQLKRIENPRAATYEEVEELVKQDYVREEKRQLTLERARSFKTRLGRDNFERLAEQNDLEFKTVEEHKREQYLGTIGDNADVDNLAFSLPLDETSDPVEYSDGCLLMHVLDRKEVTEAEFEEKREEVRANLLENKKNQYFQSFYIKLREKIGIKPNYNLFFQINNDILARYQQQ